MIDMKMNTNNKELTVQELAVKFYQYFPEWMDMVRDVERIGPCAISIKLNSGTSLVWLWVNEDDWQLGTRLWRRPPKKVEQKWKKEKQEEWREEWKEEWPKKKPKEKPAEKPMVPPKKVHSQTPADPLTVPIKEKVAKAMNGGD